MPDLKQSRFVEIIFVWLFLFSVAITRGSAQGPIRQTILPTEELVPGQTVLWCPAFQHCWDNLREMHKVDAIELKPKNKYAEYLNQFQWDSGKSLPPHGMLSFVGQNGPEFIEKVNDVLGQHFGGRVKPFSGDKWVEQVVGGIAVLTVFQRSVSFDVGFAPLVDRPFAFFNARGEPREVYAFGVMDTAPT